MKFLFHLFFVCIFTLFLFGANLAAEPQPGDTYREFVWSPEGKGVRGRWQRVTGPEPTIEKARRFLPNSVNHLDLSHLENAERAELQIELLQCHVGTIGQSFRLNGGTWRSIPPSTHIPGTPDASDDSAYHWQSMRYPIVPVPIGDLREGGNTLEFNCAPGFGLGKNWPQSLVNGAVLRVYYAAATDAPALGRVEFAAPTDPSAAGVEVRFAPDPAAGIDIVRVDFIGRYRGFDWRGEGIYHEWHYNLRRGQLSNHLGGAIRAPWRTQWDTTWLPEQPDPVLVAARVIDSTGLCRITAATELSDLRQPANTRVVLLEPYDVPQRWHTRAGRRQSCHIRFPDDNTQLREVRVIVATWNGHGADAIGINDVVIAADIGRDHDLSYDQLTVPLGAVRPGENEFFTASATKEHGIEVQWPGFVVLARYKVPHATGSETGED